MKTNKPAVVVLSGGQDSITCLGLALANKHESVHAISFRYNQRHSVELACACAVCEGERVPWLLVDLPMLATLVTSALTGEGDVAASHAYKPGLPASFVPARNALFLTLAHAYAQEKGAATIYTGVCQTDFSGYPDCRDHFVRTLALALNFGYETDISIVTPLMNLTKAETFALAEKIGFLETVLEGSHTCYNGDRSKRHPWGYGCGQCPACKLREAGFARYLEGHFNADLVNGLVPC